MHSIRYINLDTSKKVKKDCVKEEKKTEKNCKRQVLQLKEKINGVFKGAFTRVPQVDQHG
jgi:hypothetical protein